MSVLAIILLVIGIICLIGGAVRLFNRSWIDGIIILAVGLILLGVGGFVHF